jgi:hypothetical protein
MLIGSNMAFVTGVGGFAPLGADFDGTNDYMARAAALVGTSDSASFTFSAWVRLDGGDASDMTLLSFGSQGNSSIKRTTGNKFSAYMTNTGGIATVEFATVGSYTSSSTWRHVLISSNASTTHMYINNSSDNSVVYGPTGGSSNFSQIPGVGALNNGVRKMNGAMAEVWFDTTYMDLSSATNRQKFIGLDGKPVDLGSNGSTPTGSQPKLYLSLRSGDAVTELATNRGSGGNFTITGTLDLISPSPWA